MARRLSTITGFYRYCTDEAASHADPRTTMRYDRARGSLDRHATYIVATYLAGATPITKRYGRGYVNGYRQTPPPHGWGWIGIRLYVGSTQEALPRPRHAKTATSDGSSSRRWRTGLLMVSSWGSATAHQIRPDRMASATFAFSHPSNFSVNHPVSRVTEGFSQ